MRPHNPSVPTPAPPASPSPSDSAPALPKRRQVKNACNHCQKASKKCDDNRPCLRCVTYGLQDDCRSSARKQRLKGIKRGPYKKRDTTQANGGAPMAGQGPPPSPPASSSLRFTPNMHPSFDGPLPFLNYFPPHPTQYPGQFIPSHPDFQQYDYSIHTSSMSTSPPSFPQFYPSDKTPDHPPAH